MCVHVWGMHIQVPVHVCSCVHECACLCVLVSVCVSVRYRSIAEFPHSSSCLLRYSNTGTEPSNHQFTTIPGQRASEISLPLSLPPTIISVIQVFGFYMGARNLNGSLYTCKTGALLIRISPQPLSLVFDPIIFSLGCFHYWFICF